MVIGNSLKKNIVVGAFWWLSGQFSYLAVALISNIIFARILSPFEFGQVGIVMFFIVISKVLTESGLSGALIRKKEISEEDYSTVFIFNLLISLGLMLLLILAAGPIADFYNDDELENILRVSSLVLLINAFQITQRAKLIQKLQFKKKVIYEFVGIFVAACIAIIMAFNGFGVWAIVGMQILTALFIAILFWTFEGGLSVFVFSKTSFRSLYKFGINTTLSSILNTFFDNIYQLILGKYFSINQTGLFYQAKKIQEIPIGVLTSLAHSVIFSSLAKVQDEKIQFNLLFTRIITTLSVLLGFICLFVVLYAENIIVLLFGAQWAESAFFLKILIVAAFFHMQEIFNQVIFKTFDQTQKILYLELVKKVIQSISIFIGVIFMNISILLYGFLITSILSYFINVYYARKEMNESVSKELLRSFKIIVSASITAGVMFFLIFYFKLKGNYSFFLTPVMIFVYFSLLRVLGVFVLIKDLRIILNNIRKSND